MNSADTAQQANSAQALTRRILLAFLGLIVIIAVAALFVRNTISRKSVQLAQMAGNIDSSQSKPEEVLLHIYQANDDFQESLIYGGGQSSADYKSKLKLAFAQIDTLLNDKMNTASLTPQQTGKIKDWYRKKIALSDTLHALKQNFDSLLNLYADFTIETDRDGGKTSMDGQNNTTDTLWRSAQKKKLVKRIKDAIANKDGETGIKEILLSRYEHDKITKNMLAQNTAAYSRKLQMLQQQNAKLLDVQRKLTALNTHIINEMNQLIDEIKDINYNIANEFKRMALQSYKESTELLNKLYFIALTLVVTFALLLILLILQLNRSELELVEKIKKLDSATAQLNTSNTGLERALSLKNKLISIISHDLIGSIHALNGALKFISKEDMNVPRQKQALNEISASSEQLTIFADDIVTWVQFQQQDELAHLRLKTTCFDVQQLVQEKWEILALRASTKKVALKVEGKAREIATDRKILGIIIYNILSNAIKFTEDGSIRCNMTLHKEQMQLQFADTGKGFTDKLMASYNADKINYISPEAGTNNELGKGMGLIIIKDLATQINATILIGNNANGGAVVQVCIPPGGNEANIP